MIAFSYDIIKLPTTGKAMTVRSSDARSPGGWLVSLGIGFAGRVHFAPGHADCWRTRSNRA